MLIEKKLMEKLVETDWALLWKYSNIYGYDDNQ